MALKLYLALPGVALLRNASHTPEEKKHLHLGAVLESRTAPGVSSLSSFLCPARVRGVNDSSAPGDLLNNRSEVYQCRLLQAPSLSFLSPSWALIFTASLSAHMPEEATAAAALPLPPQSVRELCAQPIAAFAITRETCHLAGNPGVLPECLLLNLLASPKTETWILTQTHRLITPGLPFPK